MVDVVALDEEDWAVLLTMHHDLTSSQTARQRLEPLGSEPAASFWKIVPKGVSTVRDREVRTPVEIHAQPAPAFQ
jgi:hypothetical protein